MVRLILFYLLLNSIWAFLNNNTSKSLKYYQHNTAAIYNKGNNKFSKKNVYIIFTIFLF